MPASIWKIISPLTTWITSRSANARKLQNPSVLTVRLPRKSNNGASFLSPWDDLSWEFMEKTNSESNEWRKMVKPLVGVMISLLSAGVVYLKSHSEISESHDRQVADYAVLKARVISNSESILQFKAEQNALKQTLSDMRADVSFIRGKMEGTNK